MARIGDTETVGAEKASERGSAADPAELCAHRLGRGDPKAVEEVRERVDRILAHRGFAMAQQDRDDVRQEVMIQLWQAVTRPSFDPAAGFWSFVELVTARRAIDWLRRQSRSVADLKPSPSAGVTPSAAALEREKRQMAQRALSALDPSCRELVTLHLEKGRSYRELAQILGRSEGALRVQMYRCIRRVRKILDDLSARADARPGGET